MRRRRDLRAEPDDALVDRAGAGDADALEVLLRRHYDRVLAVCRRVTANATDADDAAQQALIAITRGIARFDRRSSFTTWIHRIAVNASLDELRRRSRRPAVALPDSLADRSDRFAVDARIADQVDIDRALATLPDDYRIAVVLRDLADLDYAQIAEVLDIPPGTVRSRIARGRAALAHQLGNPDGSDRRPRGQP